MKHSLNMIVPTIVVSITILGLAVILHGGLVDIQLGPDTVIKVVGPEKTKTQQIGP